MTDITSSTLSNPNLPMTTPIVKALNPSLIESIKLPTQIVSLPDNLKNLTEPFQITGTLSLVSHSFLKENGQLLILNTSKGVISLDFSLQDFLNSGGSLPEGKSWEQILKEIITGKIPLTCQLNAGTPPRTAELGLPAQYWGKTGKLSAKDELFKSISSPAPQPSSSPTNPTQSFLKPLETNMTIDCVRLPETSWRVLGSEEGEVLLKGIATQEEYTNILKNHPLRHQSCSETMTIKEQETPLKAEKLGEEKFTVREIVSQPNDKVHPPSVVKATIIGKTAQGHLLLSVEKTTYFVRTPVTAPKGTQILIERLQKEIPTPPESAQTYATSAEKMSAILDQIQKTPLEKEISPHFPQANEKLPTTLLLFFHALTSGKIDTWLKQALTIEHNELKKRETQILLAEAVESPTQTCQDKDVGQWKLIHFPLYDGQNLQMAPLYVHHESRDKKEARTDQERTNKTRFIVNVTLSKLGAIQVDGLSKEKHLDLIIRSETPFPKDLPQTLRSTYTLTLEALGLTGTLFFQTSANRQGWVTPNPIDTEKTTETIPNREKTV